MKGVCSDSLTSANLRGASVVVSVAISAVSAGQDVFGHDHAEVVP